MIDSPFVYLAQTNPVACDLEGNAKQILDAAKTAHELGASICVTPAMSLTGWPLEGWSLSRLGQRLLARWRAEAFLSRGPDF